MDTTEYANYALIRDAGTIAAFVTKVANHRTKLALYKAGTGEFPRPIGKNAKWPAYEAAGRIERTLELGTHAGSVPELAALVGVALAAAN